MLWKMTVLQFLLNIRNERKNVRWKKASGRLDCRIVNKNRCSLEGGYASKGYKKEAFQRYVNLEAQKQWTVLA